MDWKVLVTVFGTVLIAEPGDKTQLATLLFAADKEVSKWLVFVGASLALIATSALAMLTVPDAWLSVAYVMFAQALSGIAKDLNKMSAKASVKSLTGDGGEGRLFKYVAVLTGSKNALKGAGFMQGLAGCLWWSAGFVLVACVLSLKLPEVSHEPAKVASARV